MPSLPPVLSSVTSQQLFLREAIVRLTNLKTQDQVDVKKLRVKFDVKKGITSTPNEGTIEIYNLSPSIRKFSEIPTDKENKVTAEGLYIELSAGYQNIVRQIFTGYASGGSEYQAPDWVSKFRVVDGKLAIRDKAFSKTYKAGTPVASVIKDLTDTFKLPYDYISPVLTTDVVKFGLTLSGNVRELLDKYGEKYSFTWSIQNNAILLTSLGVPVPGKVINLTPKTGLLSRPVRTDKGIEFSCLLIPSLAPGVLVNLSDGRDFQGIALVNLVHFKGDTHEGEFKAFVEAKLL